MSIQALNWAFAQDLKPSNKITLIALANFADKDGNAWPSYSKLTACTSLTKPSVITKIKELQKQGFIEKVSRSRNDGSRNTNVYKLACG